MRLSPSVLAAFLTLSSTSAFADPASGRGTWREDHPRRAEVNDRLANQRRRINEGEKTGKLTKAQGQQLHQEDHAIRKEERAMAAEHNGHITKGEKRELNQQENNTSRQIYNEKHPGATPANGN